MVLPEESVLPVPEGLSSVQASALWMAYLTAYGGVIESCNVQPGEWIAITAATSSVGQAAIQIGVQQGAKPVAITLTSDHREELLAMGAHAVIAVQEAPLQQQLQEITKGDLTCAFDAVGGSQVVDLASAMRPGGTLVLHGALSDEDTPFPLKLALRRSLTFRGYVYTEVTDNFKVLGQAQAFISAGIRSGVIQPVIDAEFALTQVVEAHRYLETGKHFGKIVLIP